MKKVSIIVGLCLLCVLSAYPALGQTPTLVSINRAGTKSNNSSEGQAISADGRFVAFASTSTDLVVTNDANGPLNDVFVRDLQTGTTQLVSINNAGNSSGNGASFGPVISSNGRFIAFVSQAADLVSASDTNGTYDVFVRDLQMMKTTLVSVNADGTASGNQESFNQVMTPDGRFVAFGSEASDLVPNDANGIIDVFVRDLQAGETNLVSINHAGTGSGNDFSDGPPSISANGRFIAFMSIASDLVATRDTNFTFDVFVRDMQMKTTTLVSVNNAGTDSANTASDYPIISSDGKVVVFGSYANDLTSTPDYDSTYDIFARNLVSGVTSLVSVNKEGTRGGDGDCSFLYGVSSNGRYVTFSSTAPDLVAYAVSGGFNAYVRDLQTGKTTLINVNRDGTAGSDKGADVTGISATGQVVVFRSRASDLVPLSNASFIDNIFTRDLRTGKTTLVSINKEGTGGGNNRSYLMPSLSANGQVVAFASQASNLVVNDTNAKSDIFAFTITKVDLSLTQTESADSVLLGDNVTYKIDLTNNSVLAAVGVVLTDTLPSGSNFVSATSTLGRCAQLNGVVTCTISRMANAETATVTIVVKPVSSGKITNTARVTHNAADPNLANNVAAQSAQVVKLLSLSLDQSSVTGCKSVTGTVKLSGPAPAAGAVVQLIDSLAATSLPPAVTIPAGAISKTFTVTPKPVSTTQSGTVEASLRTVNLSQPLTIRAAGVLSLALSPNPVVGPNPVTGTVTLECPAPAGGITVTLSSSAQAVASPTASTLLIPAGVSSKTFGVRTADVSTARSVTIKATANGVAKGQVLKVYP